MNDYKKINILAEMARIHEPVIFHGNMVGYIQDMDIRYGGEITFTIETMTGPWDQTDTIKDVKLEDIRMPYFANHPIPTMSAGVFKEYRLPEIKNVNYQYKSGLTVVIWKDGTKTFVKCKDEVFDEEKALAMAIAKKAMGNEYKYFEKIKKFLPKIEKDG